MRLAKVILEKFNIQNKNDSDGPPLDTCYLFGGVVHLEAAHSQRQLYPKLNHRWYEMMLSMGNLLHGGKKITFICL